jgi:hypothetical protein
MLRFAALPTCVGLLTGFFLAPFQHVHSGHGPGDLDHVVVMHAHFYAIPARQTKHTGRQVDDDDDHEAVWAVNTFTLVMTAGIPPFILSRASALFFVPSPVVQPVALVEERGHDPPSFGQLVPRAPPA